MTALRVKSHEPEMTSAHDSPTRVDDSRAMEAKAWTHKLRHHSDVADTHTHTRDAEVVEASSKRHRFSLRRLFRHEHHDKKAAFVPPVPIPTDFLTREKHGGVTVSGKRVPFTRDAHKRRRKAVKPLPRINEDRTLLPVATSKSMDEYRRRAYYPARKDKSKK